MNGLTLLPLELFIFSFMLLFARLGTMIMIFPVFSDPAISVRIRLLFSIFLSFALFPLLQKSLPSLPSTTANMLLLLGTEIIIGILLGLAARLLYMALSLAGEVIAFMAGFQSATLFDPSSGANTAAPSIFLTLSASTMFLALNLHHEVILSFIASYGVFPAGNIPSVADAASGVINVIAQAFILGTKLAAPVMVAGMLALAMFGVFNRLIPQLQVFFVSIPISISLSLLVLSATVSLILSEFTSFLSEHLFLPAYTDVSF